MLLEDVGYDATLHDAMVRVAKDESWFFDEFLSALTIGYCALYKLTPAEINEGMCQDFAQDLVKHFPEATACWDDDLDLGSPGCHCFVEYKGLYYDSECHDGVEDWRDLPLFVRFFCPVSIKS